MTGYIVKRILFVIPVLFGITLLTFVLFNVFSGDPAARFAGKHATAESLAAIRSDLGLDRSLPEQYVDFLRQIGTMDFGRSWSTKQKISRMISDGFSATLCLTLPPFIASVLACLGLSLLMASRRGSLLDKGLVVACLAFLSLSSLVYILALQYFFAYKQGWFPISGWDPSWTERWQYLQLPWIILFVLLLGGDILVYRSVLVDETNQDYVRTARAKGASGYRIWMRHILKNALVPIITLIVIEPPLLITGAVLIENFFGIPGMGGLLVNALNESDFPVIKAMTVFTSIAYMIFNVGADLLYAIVDPRIKFR